MRVRRIGTEPDGLVFGGLDFGVEVDARACGDALALVFPAVGLFDVLVGEREDELADAASGFDAHGGGIGVVEFEGDGAFESGVDPAGVLDEEAEAADGAAALDEGGEVVGQPDDLDGGGEDEAACGDDEFVGGDLVVLGGLGQGAYAVGGARREEGVSQAQVDGGGSDLLGPDRLDRQFVRFQHFFNRFVGQNHDAFP